MFYDKSKKKNFRYVKSILDKFGRIFSSEGDEKFTITKIQFKNVFYYKRIKKSEGIVLFILIILMEVLFLWH